VQIAHNYYNQGMNQILETIRQYFAKLGLTPEVADLYAALYTGGPQSISSLARTADVERTRIYRLLDELQTSGLVEVETHAKRSIFRAASIENVQILLSKKEQELKQLQQDFGQLTQLLAQNDATSPFTHVQFYKGPEGLKQMLWNQTKSTTEQVSILHEALQLQAKDAFFARWVQAFNQKGIRVRGVVGDSFLKSQHQWYSSHSNERLAHWQSRYIAPDTFPITHSTVVYNDVVAYQSWKDGEIFGIEIYNADIANAQRHFFETLWQQAKPVKLKVGDTEIIP
jgi:sugar-specific transcriptional regulator TrmB